MPNTMDRIKPWLLMAAIALGTVLHGKPAEARDIQTMVVAGGCFWCVEADFEKVRGVQSAVSGYTGGTVASPTYRQVARGGTGHYEAVRITYDADVTDYRTMLDLFFRSVDPTDAGGQFCDRGESYRTAIFVSDAAEGQVAEAAKAAAEAELGRQIVTPILEAGTFYEAEDYHQDYYRSSEVILTRAGPKTKANAYEFYRDACRRDQRVRALWGSNAPFAG